MKNTPCNIANTPCNIAKENPTGFIGLVSILILIPFANKGLTLDSLDLLGITAIATSASLIMNDNLSSKTHLLFGVIAGLEAFISSKI